MPRTISIDADTRLGELVPLELPDGVAPSLLGFLSRGSVDDRGMPISGTVSLKSFEEEDL